MSGTRGRAMAFAPASVGNVAVGFDVLGYSASFAGDRVRAARTVSRGVRIAAITGVVTIDKGIPLGSGLGGSAASAVAAVVAANALLDDPVDNLRLLKFAMRGEQV